ncbi:hypothetical protein EON83_23415 [bacterium]|nr:MAG: hypothetical protein EON83_23415 [bacterium]
MKSILTPLLCLLAASTAVAAPQITEIRLQDAPGFVAPPILINELVFRSDGNFYWNEGTLEKPVKHRYSIGSEGFQKLAAALETHGFFELKPKYDRLKPTDPLIMDGSSVVVSATRDGIQKHVVDYSGFGPSNLWEVEMIIRGFASQYIGMKRTPIIRATVAKSTPPRTSTPIPVIRGTQKTPN